MLYGYILLSLEGRNIHTLAHVFSFANVWKGIGKLYKFYFL
jgi:hypothetical protein